VILVSMMFTKLPGGFTQVFEIPLPALAWYLSLLRQLRYTRFMQTFLLFSLIEDLLVIDPSLLLSPAFFSLLFYLKTWFGSRAVKFSIQIGSVWPQMGQIWDFLDQFQYTLIGDPKSLDFSHLVPIWPTMNYRTLLQEYDMSVLSISWQKCTHLEGI